MKERSPGWVPPVPPVPKHKPALLPFVATIQTAARDFHGYGFDSIEAATSACKAQRGAPRPFLLRPVTVRHPCVILYTHTRVVDSERAACQFAYSTRLKQLFGFLSPAPPGVCNLDGVQRPIVDASVRNLGGSNQRLQSGSKPFEANLSFGPVVNLDGGGGNLFYLLSGQPC